MLHRLPKHVLESSGFALHKYLLKHLWNINITKPKYNIPYFKFLHQKLDQTQIYTMSPLNPYISMKLAQQIKYN